MFEEAVIFPHGFYFYHGEIFSIAEKYGITLRLV